MLIQIGTLGSHTLVIADHNGAFQPNVQAQIDYTQPGAMMRRDSIDRWRSQRRWQTNGIELQSWDYRQINTRPLQSHSANGNNDGSDGNMPLVSQDTPGSYSYESRDQGQRIANNQLQALEAHNKLFIGAGTVRTLSPGTRFTLNGQSAAEWDQSDDDRNFVILRVVHQAHNNLSADLQAHVAQSLGLPHQDIDIDTDVDADTDTHIHTLSLFHNLTNADQQKGERALYRNRFDAIRSKIPYRPLGTDAHGKRLHPKPTVQGQQTAIVVGPQGEVIHTDRDHRIKVQFHWMRGGSNGSNSHSRLQHPNPDGHTGAPANDHSGTWVRVAATLAPVAGANWGSHTIPRIGQEVLIDFIEGDIDRPLVIGTLYNGQGQADAQYNQQAQGTGSATGNAPAWFPGQTDDGSNGHAHPAALSGIKTQAMSASQQGTGSYNQLVFDDSPNESRTSLQSHANPHEGSSELNLGHLRHQTDNQRLGKVGFGAELKTQHSVAVRAGQGLLISADARTNASGSQLDCKEAQAQLDSSHTLQQSLAQTAQQHNAKLKDDKQQDEPAPEKLPAIQQQANTLKVLQATEGSSDSNANNGGQGKVTAYSEPHLQLSSPAGTPYGPYNIETFRGDPYRVYRYFVLPSAGDCK
ncbi:uncharacterized protein involved in type VI secretion and phage assembly [Undibacterium sp. GrIS 1.8]